MAASDGSVTPRRRRASLGRVGDIARPDVLQGLATKVRLMLREVTHGVVTLVSQETASLETEFVLSSNALQEPLYSAIRRAIPRYLGHGWTTLTDTRYLFIDGMPNAAHSLTSTLVLRYHSRAIGGLSFTATVAAAGVTAVLLLTAVYYLYWLIFVVRDR